MKKLLFVFAAAASIGMVSCSAETTDVTTENERIETPDGDQPDVHVEPIDVPPLDDTTDAGIDSSDVVPEPEVLEVSTRL